MKIFILLFTIFLFYSNVNAFNMQVINMNQARVIAVVKTAEKYIKKFGKKRAIIEFKKHSVNIFIGDYKGMFFVSPIHPEMIGHSQWHYKDSSGVFVVQEEINKAKRGGGWLKGRWRINPQIEKYQCRKIYILPMPGNYFIGSWYYYFSAKPGICAV